MAARPYDLVLVGATGFTGGLVAEYLTAHAPASCRWALAGRNRGKLEALRDRLGVDVPLLHAEAGNAEALGEIAQSARVVATTVGPYVRYGEPLVAACADAGTDYVDLAGEPEFVDRMYVRRHARAVETGARLVHSCGFESVPPDLGVYYTVQRLPEGVPLRVRGYVRAAGMLSGGTLHSAVTAFSRPRENLAAMRDRRRVEPRPSGRQVHAVRGRPGWDRDVRAWRIPLPTIDAAVVARSARALDRYGPDFTYQHFAAARHLPMAVGGAAGVAAVVGAAQVPPLRRWLLRRLAPGQGPSPEKRARSWFSVRFVGEGGGARVRTEVAGGDPGYGETAVMLAESALCLAFDELPPTRGQVTPAAAMGNALIDRLVSAGVTFRQVP